MHLARTWRAVPESPLPWPLLAELIARPGPWQRADNSPLPPIRAGLVSLADPGEGTSTVPQPHGQQAPSCVLPPDVTLRIAIGGGSAGRPITMINYVRTGEQTWSKHSQETAIDKAKEIAKSPGQYGCAARDLNPGPAD
jgi:hypothetical protein